jgi:hypothetical protein
VDVEVADEPARNADHNPSTMRGAIAKEFNDRGIPPARRSMGIASRCGCSIVLAK